MVRYEGQNVFLRIHDEDHGSKGRAAAQIDGSAADGSDPLGDHTVVPS